MPMFYYYWDPTYILVLIGVLICGAASMIVNSTMNKYRRVGNSRGITGGEAARRILDSEGLYQVKVECLRSGFAKKILMKRPSRRWGWRRMSAGMPFSTQSSMCR